MNLLARFFSRNSFKATSSLGDKGYIGLYRGFFPGSRSIARSISRFGASFSVLALEKTSR
jgi:hypothetical protein